MRVTKAVTELLNKLKLYQKENNKLTDELVLNTKKINITQEFMKELSINGYKVYPNMEMTQGQWESIIYEIERLI